MQYDFSEIILFLRKTGMSDTEVARRAGTSAGIISRITKGTIPRYDVGLALLALYEERRAHLASLLGRDPTEGCHE